MTQKRTIGSYLRGAKSRLKAAVRALCGDYAAEAFVQQLDEARRERNALRGELQNYLSGPRDFKVLGEIHRKITATEKELRGLKDSVKSVASRPTSARFSALEKPAHYKRESERVQQIVELKERRLAGEPLSITELELLSERKVPLLTRRSPPRRAPSARVAFLTVANGRFFRGVEALLLSLLDVYPELTSDFYIYHDSSMTSFAQALLRDIYPHCIFVEDEMEWLDLGHPASDNQRRIGKLGYMNLNALRHASYEHVVILDSDLLITDDISALWEHDDRISICYDCGDREYAAYSKASGDFIFNSGVISVPKLFLTPDYFDEIKALASACGQGVNCALLDRFADQKIWNIFLKGKPKNILPINYNCNIKYVAKHMNGRTEGLSVIHFAGPKPWLTKDYVADEHLGPGNPTRSTTYHERWEMTFRELKFKWRSRQFADYLRASGRSTPVRSASIAHDGRRTCVLIGNGPSIEKTEFSIIDRFEKFCFNWFILHDEFETFRPDHLVLPSHMFFGGWNTLTPTFPEGYLERLTTLVHKPVIWTSLYFRPLFEEIGLEREFEVNYFLFEKPFKHFIDQVGATPCDITNFLDDGRTGVLTAGAPIARHLGFERIVLVGCDSNYNQQDDSGNYFYANELHTSASTRTESLSSTWTQGGPGHFVYAVVRRSLEERGYELLDATVDGALTTLPKIRLEEIETGLHTRDLETPRSEITTISGEAPAEVE